MAKYIECDKCGCIHKSGDIDSRHIITVILTRPEQNDIKKDLCDECYRHMQNAMNEVYPKEGLQ